MDGVPGQSAGRTQVPDGWLLARLGDVAEFQQGGTPPKSRPEFWDGIIPFVTGADLRGFRVSKDNARSFLTDEGLCSGATVICKPGSLLLATRTRVGLVGIASETIGASQDITLVMPGDSADHSYLSRVLLSSADKLQRTSRGTTIQGVTREDISSLPVLLPPLAEQRAIAGVLDSIDEAIERTEEVIAATERLRDSLLHQLLTRGVPGWHSEWKEAPGIGTIPACWDVVRLGAMIEDGPSNGIYKPEAEYGRGTWIIRIDDFIPGSLVSAKGFQRIQATEEECSRYLVNKGEILINRVNSLSHIGKSVLIPQLNEPTLFESNMMKLRMCSDVHSKFAAKFLLSSNCRQYFNSRAKKAVQQASINQQDVTEMPFPLPTLEEQQAIAVALEGVDEAIGQARRERDGLQLLKASAADALLTGRVRVGGTR